jgi:hypothetical protein
MPPGDDRSFTRLGIPTLSVAVLPALEAHQLWLAVNAGAASGLAPGTTPPILRTIHTAEDTPEKVSEETMTTMICFVLSLVRSLDGR